ncbi:MAG: hypothetical protein ACYDA0_11495 [Candidatus Dormibacteraceae bacterium]
MTHLTGVWSCTDQSLADGGRVLDNARLLSSLKESRRPSNATGWVSVALKKINWFAWFEFSWKVISIECFVPTCRLNFAMPGIRAEALSKT